MRKPKYDLIAKDIPFGGFFICADYPDEVLLRVKPVGYILNSDLVNTAINNNAIFAVKISTARMRIINGDRKVRYFPSSFIQVVEQGELAL